MSFRGVSLSDFGFLLMFLNVISASLLWCSMNILTQELHLLQSNLLLSHLPTKLHIWVLKFHQNRWKAEYPQQTEGSDVSGMVLGQFRHWSSAEVLASRFQDNQTFLGSSAAHWLWLSLPLGPCSPTSHHQKPLIINVCTDSSGNSLKKGKKSKLA